MLGMLTLDGRRKVAQAAEKGCNDQEVIDAEVFYQDGSGVKSHRDGEEGENTERKPRGDYRVVFLHDRDITDIPHGDKSKK